MIEMGGDYCEILHTHKDYDTANRLIIELTRFKEKEKKRNFEINLLQRKLRIDLRSNGNQENKNLTQACIMRMIFGGG